MATLQQEQVRTGQGGNSGSSQGPPSGNGTEALEINEFMLKMIEVLNKRFGAVNHQLNEISAKSAGKVELAEKLAELRAKHDREKEDLLARITLLDNELVALKNSLKPPEPKVNKNILKHLE
ncbi:MAG: hypothetical protein V1820_06055 [archaeon]